MLKKIVPMILMTGFCQIWGESTLEMTAGNSRLGSEHWKVEVWGAPVSGATLGLLGWVTWNPTLQKPIRKKLPKKCTNQDQQWDAGGRQITTRQSQVRIWSIATPECSVMEENTH